LNENATRYISVTLAALGAGALLALFAISVTASPSVVSSSDSHATTLAIAASTPITLPSPCWRIGIATDGLYRISYETMDGAGVPVAGADPADFHLLWRGHEVALQAVGDGDPTFEPGESFLFYAVKFHGSIQDEKYTDENVYWLTVDDSTAGLRMDERSVAPGGGGYTYMEWYTATAHVEENTVYWARWTNAPGSDATWFWQKIEADNTILTYTYPITLSAPAPATYTAVLRVEMAGYTDYDVYHYVHDVRFSLNGTIVGEASWLGSAGYTATLPVSSTLDLWCNSRIDYIWRSKGTNCAVQPPHMAGNAYCATSLLIQEGANDLTITILAASSRQMIYFDRVELDYRRLPEAEDDVILLTTPLSGTTAMMLTEFTTSTIHLYEVSHPLTSTRLTGGFTYLPGSTYALILIDTAPAGTTYLAVAESQVSDVVSLTVTYPPADLPDPTEGADEIIVVPTQFITAVQPLADRRRSQGLRVRVVDVNDVYALFNGGVVHPEAIRSFVAYAYANWPGDPPKYLLLFGDGNFNPKGYNPAVYGEFEPTLIPPYLEFADPGQGEVPVDARFGDVDWGGMPEVMVGRISAGTVAQAEGVVAKILAYESTPVAPWMMRAIMVADNYDALKDLDFGAIAKNLENHLPADMVTSTIYLDDYSSTPSATQDLTQTWSQGAAMLTYVGHGRVHWWAHEHLLLNTQMTQLTNTVGLPFLLSLDCWDGYWMFPPDYPLGAEDVRSIGEWATTVLTDRGAIAAFGPAGLAPPEDEEVMAQAMYQALFGRGVYRLGELTQVGREAISDTYASRTYTLLGDPAMYLKVNLSPRAYMPLALRDY